MSPLQFSLFFVALLIAYLLVHVRLIRFERYLQEVAVLRQLNERLQRLSDVFEGLSLEGVEDRLEALQADVRAATEAVGRLERVAVRSQPAPPAPMPTPAEAAGTDSQRIRALVETCLIGLGYHDLHILSDLDDVSLDDEVEVVVECEKGQTVHKGKVVTRHGAIRDVHLKSIVQAFP